MLDWITELPNHYLPYLKKSKASSTKKELPVVSFMLDGALESEIYDFTMKRGCKLAVLKEKVSFKSLNYAYLTLEKTGFNRIDTENILRNNLGNHVTTMFWWACLNIDHDKLPAGFVDKSEHALKTSKISVVYRKNMDAQEVSPSSSHSLLNASTENEMVIKNPTDRGLEAESGKQKENPSQPDGHISNVTDVTSNDTVLNAMSWMYDSDSSGDDSTSINSGFRRLEVHGNRPSSNTKSQKKSPWTKERIQAAREESAEKEEMKIKLEKDAKTKENENVTMKKDLMADFGDPILVLGQRKLDPLII